MSASAASGLIPATPQPTSSGADIPSGHHAEATASAEAAKNVSLTKALGERSRAVALAHAADSSVQPEAHPPAAAPLASTSCSPQTQLRPQLQAQGYAQASSPPQQQLMSPSPLKFPVHASPQTSPLLRPLLEALPRQQHQLHEAQRTPEPPSVSPAFSCGSPPPNQLLPSSLASGAPPDPKVLPADRELRLPPPARQCAQTAPADGMLRPRSRQPSPQLLSATSILTCEDLQLETRKRASSGAEIIPALAPSPQPSSYGSSPELPADRTPSPLFEGS